jgi:hypothetical protein
VLARQTGNGRISEAAVLVFGDGVEQLADASVTANLRADTELGGVALDTLKVNPTAGRRYSPEARYQN